MEPDIHRPAPHPALEPAAAPPRTFARRIDCGNAPKVPAAVPVHPAVGDGKPGVGGGA
jgi:hypothetical protein